MEFSGIVKITELNDFLSPSENCSVHSSMIKTSERATATVSLSDCLACSGCVTSAESVLLEQHSIARLLEHIPSHSVTVSLSQQSVAAISHTFGLEFEQCIRQMRAALLSAGVHKVHLMCESRDIVLEAAFTEFIARFKARRLPVICSECPGWVSYAEKKADANVLSLLSQVKTPMMVQREVLGITGYHAAVMPCYDKKLEAVRDSSVDLVLTTKELLSFLSELEFWNYAGVPGDSFYSSTKVKTGSLGYGEYIFLRTIKELYGEDPELNVKTTRRRDIVELEYREITFALASGFQNIQNIVRSLKQGKTQYSFIEMMACPSGCLNGGGQPQLSRVTLESLEAVTGEFYKEPARELSVPISLYRTHESVRPSPFSW